MMDGVPFIELQKKCGRNTLWYNHLIDYSVIADHGPDLPSYMWISYPVNN